MNWQRMQGFDGETAQPDAAEATPFALSPWERAGVRAMPRVIFPRSLRDLQPDLANIEHRTSDGESIKKMGVQRRSALILTLSQGERGPEQRRHTAWRVVIWFIAPLTITTSLLAPTTFAQREFAGPVAEGMFLDTDAAAAKKLAAARDLIAARQWGDALDLLRQTAEQHSDKLVSVAAGRYVAVQTYCDLLLSGLPPEGLKLYRQRTDPQARRWFEAARPLRDEAGLRRIVRRAFLSSVGDDALDLLGLLAWERGDFSQARTLWERLLPHPPGEAETPTALRYPDAEISPAIIRARLVLCSLLQRDLARGERELAAFRRLHPQDEGELAGNRGKLVQILEAQAGLARQSVPTDEPVESSTFAGNPRRNLVLPHPVDVGSVLWSAPLEEVRVEHPARSDEQAFERAFPDRPERPFLTQQRETLAYFPVVHQNLVLYCDETAVYARELFAEAGGQGPWGGAPLLYRLPNDSLPPTLSLSRRRAGWPRYSLSVDGERAYARLGPLAQRGRQRGGAGNASTLVCLDLSRQGDLLWSVSAAKIDTDGGTWTFDGAPLVANDRVYVALRRFDPQLQLNAACLDAATGKLLWNRKIGLTLEALGGEVDEIHHQLLTLADDQLFYCTNSGAVASLDAREGSLRWVTAYPRGDVENTASFNKRQAHGPNPCVVHEGFVYAAPQDGDRVVAFEAETGVLAWDRPLRGNVQLVGVCDGRLIAAGDLLYGLDPESGRLEWTAGQMTPAVATRGRAALAAGLVYWPRQDEIQVVEARSGRVAREIDLAEHYGLPGGGNIVLADGALILAQTNKLAVFSEYAGMRKRLDDELAKQPTAVRPLLQLSLLEESARHPNAAIEALRRALGSATNTKDSQRGQAPTERVIRQRLTRLLSSQAERELAASQPEAAIALLNEAISTAKNTPREQGLRRRVALAYEKTGDNALAVKSWQDLLERAIARPADSMAGGTSAVREARLKVSELVDRYGREVYREIEVAARKGLHDALTRRNFAELGIALRRYPHAVSTQDAAVLAALQTPNDPTNALDRIAQDLIDAEGPADTPLKIAAMTGTALRAEHRKQPRLAARSWQKLADTATSARVTIAGRTENACELAKARLAALGGTTGSRPDREASSIPWERRWERRLTERVQSLIPTGAAPSEGCVLIGESPLTCLSMADGRVLWQLDLAEPVEWAGFAGGVLVLSTAETITGVIPEEGRMVWQRPRFSSAQGTTHSEFRVAADRLFCLEVGGSVTRLHPQDGTVVWRYEPHRGALQRGWYCAGDVIALQTLAPDRWQILDARDGAIIAEASGPAAPAPQEPVAVHGGRLLGLADGDKGPRVIEVATGKTVTTYRGPESLAFVPTGLLTNGQSLVAAVDGTTLASFAADTGAVLWSRRMGATVVEDPAHSGLLDEKRLYIVSGGILRGFTLEDGQLLWERYIGEASTDWGVARTDGAVAVYPRVSTAKCFVLLVDPATGELLERLSFPPSRQGVQLHLADRVAVVATTGGLYGFERGARGTR